MSLNDDVDQLVDSERAYRPSLLGLTLFILVTAMGAYFCTARSSPPVIGEVKRWPTVEPVLPPALHEISSVHPNGHSAPGDGPMCQAPIPEEYNGPYPTHYGVLVMEPATEAESLEVQHQMASCSRGTSKLVDPFMVLALLRLEKDLGLPMGLLGSAWCFEGALKPTPRPGDKGASHGFYQQQGWFWDWCNLPFVDAVTLDLTVATTCYAARIHYYLDDGKCPGNVTRAEAMSANGKRYKNWKCKARSLHADELARWRKVAR